jgi:hypothetical protein
MTSACWHLVVKLAVLVGGELLGGDEGGGGDDGGGDDEVGVPGVDVPPVESSPPPPQAPIARMVNAASETFLMDAVRVLICWGR